MKGFFIFTSFIHTSYALKRLTTLLFFAVCYIMNGQSHDLQVSLIRPTNGFASGVQFTFEVGFTNNGPDTIPAGDTVFFQATFNGQPLLDMGQPITYRYIFNQNLGSGQTLNSSRQLTIIGGSFGQVNVCAKITEYRGVAAGNEIDSSNWEDCKLQTYSDVSSTGTFRLLSPINKSRLETNHLIVDIEDAPISANQSAMVNLYNLNGQVVYSSRIASKEHQIFETLVIPSVPYGLYILDLHFEGHPPLRKKLSAF